MGIDAGFDMVPCLSRGAVDRQNWDQFINFIKGHYKNDAQVEINPNYLVFKAGEYPILPFEGHKFLRFSSKITGDVMKYNDAVTRLAHVHFGFRIQAWNEGFDQSGHYNWDEVHESIRSYEQVRYTILRMVCMSSHVLKISGSQTNLIYLVVSQNGSTAPALLQSSAYHFSKSRTSLRKVEASSLDSSGKNQFSANGSGVAVNL